MDAHNNLISYKNEQCIIHKIRTCMHTVLRTTYCTCSTFTYYTQTTVLSITFGRSLCAYTFHFSSKSSGRQDGEDDTDGEADTSDRLERSLSFLADRSPCGAGTRSARVRELRKDSAERPAHRHCVREGYYSASCRQKREAEGEQDKVTPMMGDANAKSNCVATSAPVLASCWLAFTKATVVAHPAKNQNGAQVSQYSCPVD